MGKIYLLEIYFVRTEVIITGILNHNIFIVCPKTARWLCDLYLGNTLARPGVAEPHQDGLHEAGHDQPCEQADNRDEEGDVCCGTPPAHCGVSPQELHEQL